MTAEVAGWLGRATRSLQAAYHNQSHGETDTCVNRAYYAMFYAVTAALAAKEIRVKRHGAAHALFHEHYIRTALVELRLHHALLDAFHMRQTADYSLSPQISSEEVDSLLTNAEALTSTLARLLEA